MPGNRETPVDGKQRLPRQQQEQAAISAQSAIAPVLGGKRKPLGTPARQQEGAAHDRQKRD